MEASREGEELGLGFPYWAAGRRRLKLDDPFFAAGNNERELLAKQVALDLTEDERYQIHKMEDAAMENQNRICISKSYEILLRSELWESASNCVRTTCQDICNCNYHNGEWCCHCSGTFTTNQSTVFCPIVGCGAQLTGLEDFEDHYRARHTASCSVCSRVYPTSRLLSIHVSEAHDSFFQAKVARGFPMYECLVEGCGVKLKSYKNRQQHLMDKHKFPSSFEFFKRAHPSKHQRQKYQRKQATYKNEEMRPIGMDVDEKATKQTLQKYKPKQSGQKEEMKETEMEVDDLVSAISKLSASDSSPSSVSFGRRHARGLMFLPRSVRQTRKQDSQSDTKR